MCYCVMSLPALYLWQIRELTLHCLVGVIKLHSVVALKARFELNLSGKEIGLFRGEAASLSGGMMQKFIHSLSFVVSVSDSRHHSV